METLLASRLKLLRNEAELLQKDIADKLNISKSAYGFYEQGKRIPDSIMLEKIAEIYDVSTDYLLGRSDIKKVESVNSAFSINVSELEEEDIEYVKGLVERLKNKHSK